MINSLEQLKECLDKAYKFKDINDIKKDIEEGKNAIKTKDEQAKVNYIDKINQKYYLYINALNVGMNLRKMTQGIESTRTLDDKNETITQYIRVLQLVYEEKLYEEILKVINNEENIFKGGVIYE